MSRCLRRTGIVAMVLGILLLGIYGIGDFIETANRITIGKAGFILIMLAALLFVAEILVDSWLNK